MHIYHCNMIEVHVATDGHLMITQKNAALDEIPFVRNLFYFLKHMTT